jgi:hypothetical protein
MEGVLVDLANALRERLAIIADGKSRRDQAQHMTRLASISRKIDMLVAQMPNEIDPQLAHFLQRQSYDKALAFIENTTRRSTAR